MAEYLDKNGLTIVWAKINETIENIENEIPTEEEINDLIDAKLGEVENGHY